MKEGKDFLDFEKMELKMPEENFLETEAEVKSSPIILVVLVIIIILLLAILSGIVWWGLELQEPQEQKVEAPAPERPTPEENNEPESTTAEAAVETMQALSSSDALMDIKADIEATKLENLTKESVIIDNLLEEALR